MQNEERRTENAELRTQNYTQPMKSVGDSLRAETRARDAALDANARVQQALALGDADARTLAAAREISIDEARRSLQRQRQQGRRRSACHESLLNPR